MILRVLAVALVLFLVGRVVFFSLRQFWLRQIQTIDPSPYMEGIAELQAKIHNSEWGHNLPIQTDDLLEIVKKNISGGELAVSGFVARLAQQAIMFTIYSVLLLVNPIAEISTVFGTVRQYFARKTVSNLIYASVCCVILASLNCTITPILGITTFFLSYIPEIGAVLTCLLPVPFFLLDIRQEYNQRSKRAILVLLLMIINKFAVGNGIEAVLMGMGSASDKERTRAGHTHPVIMIVIVMLGATVWGATGTLCAVPATWLFLAYSSEQRRRWHM